MHYTSLIAVALTVLNFSSALPLTSTNDLHVADQMVQRSGITFVRRDEKPVELQDSFGSNGEGLNGANGDPGVVEDADNLSSMQSVANGNDKTDENNGIDGKQVTLSDTKEKFDDKGKRFKKNASEDVKGSANLPPSFEH